MKFKPEKSESHKSRESSFVDGRRGLILFGIEKHYVLKNLMKILTVRLHLFFISEKSRLYEFLLKNFVA